MTSLQTVLLLSLVVSMLCVSASHGLYPLQSEVRRDEILDELPPYDDHDLSDWAAKLLEKDGRERGSTDWITRLSDNNVPRLNLKDLVVGKSRRFWNTPMGSNKGQPMALNLQTNAGRLPLGDLMKSKGPMGPLTWLTGGSSRPMPVGKLLKIVQVVASAASQQRNT